MGAPGLPVTPDLWSRGIALQPALLPRGALPLLQALLGPPPEASLPVCTRGVWHVQCREAGQNLRVWRSSLSVLGQSSSPQGPGQLFAGKAQSKATEHHKKQGAGAQQSRGQFLEGRKGSKGTGQDFGVLAAVCCLCAQGPGKIPTAEAVWGSPRSQAQPLQASKCPVRRLLGLGGRSRGSRTGAGAAGRAGAADQCSGAVGKAERLKETTLALRGSKCNLK